MGPMRYLTAALALHTPANLEAKSAPAALATQAGQPMPPLTRPWPRMNGRGLEWTEAQATALTELKPGSPARAS